MRIVRLLPALALMLSIACSSPKNTAMHQNDKALLLDGSWEADYIASLEKPFRELYPELKPSLMLNSQSGKIAGITGCNNFNGSFTLSEQSITISQDIAVTRKMCTWGLDGETAFLNTLKKVNRWAVTGEGKTLNLLMGDIAVMRLQRK